jgi:erythromycin esterase-like protein
VLHRLEGQPTDYDPLLERAAEARLVLLGEASHGTREFYGARAEITRRLIAELGFNVIAVEADWPDAYRVNCFVRGAGDDETPAEALGDFRRFPVWMWRNREVERFVGWLRGWNSGLGPRRAKTGFYGLDLYSLHTSMEAVVAYLAEVDPEAAQRARERYSCFDHFGSDPQVYAYEAGIGGAEPCEAQAVEQLIELHEMAGRAAAGDDRVAADRHFFAEQNARLVVNAERYYREMFRGSIESWNLRDSHMAEALEALVEHLGRTGKPVKAVVWAHNSHLGDARATELGEAGELNLGQLVRERNSDPGNPLLVGFSTHSGTVTAASNWGDPADRKRVRPALSGSWEDVFHLAHGPDLLLERTERMKGRRLERAIGVVYRPETERISHYFHARLAEQFDMVVHFDTTSAVEPLEVTSEWDEAELPETYPWGV